MNEPLLRRVRELLAENEKHYDEYDCNFPALGMIDAPGRWGTFAAWVLKAASEVRDYSHLGFSGIDAAEKRQKIECMQMVAKAELSMGDDAFSILEGSGYEGLFKRIDMLLDCYVLGNCEAAV